MKTAHFHENDVEGDVPSFNMLITRCITKACTVVPWNRLLNNQNSDCLSRLYYLQFECILIYKETE